MEILKKIWKEIILEIKKINIEIAKCLRFQDTFKLLPELKERKMLLLDYIYQMGKFQSLS